jgi:hypothetical protein
MPKKTFEEAIKVNALKNRQLMMLLERTKAFQRFRTNNPEIPEGKQVAKFLNTFEGEDIANKLNLSEFVTRAVSSYIDVDGSLYLRVDTSRSKNDIKSEIDFILNEKLPKERPMPPRGEGVKDIDKLNRMFKAYDLIERYKSPERAMHEIFPETKNEKTYLERLTNTKYLNICNWHKMIQKKLNNL